MVVFSSPWWNFAYRHTHTCSPKLPFICLACVPISSGLLSGQLIIRWPIYSSTNLFNTSNVFLQVNVFTSNVSPTLSLLARASHLPFEKHPKRHRLPSLQKWSHILIVCFDEPGYLAIQSAITCLLEAIPSNLVAARSPTASAPYSVLHTYLHFWYGYHVI